MSRGAHRSPYIKNVDHWPYLPQSPITGKPTARIVTDRPRPATSSHTFFVHPNPISLPPPRTNLTSTSTTCPTAASAGGSPSTTPRPPPSSCAIHFPFFD